MVKPVTATGVDSKDWGPMLLRSGLSTDVGFILFCCVTLLPVHVLQLQNRSLSQKPMDVFALPTTKLAACCRYFGPCAFLLAVPCVVLPSRV